MSDDQGTALSRRALREKRRAEEAARANATPGTPVPERGESPDQPPATGQAPREDQDGRDTARVVATANRSRRASTAPVDAVAGRPERSSQQRARDREVIRARRELEQVSAKPGSAKSGSAKPGSTEPAPQQPPTRRQLRQSALAAAKAASGGAQPQAKGAADAGASTNGSQKRTSAPATASREPRNAHVPDASTAPGSRNDTPAEGEPDGMSVEAALAARRQAAREAGPDADRGAAPAGESRTENPFEPGDTGLVDLEVLARQRELAARAAVISRRVAERERLAQANSERLQQAKSDPFTGAMHQIQDPAAEKELANTGIRGPVTSGVRLELSGPGAGRGGGTPSSSAKAPSLPGHGAGRGPANGSRTRTGTPAGGAAQAADEAAASPVRATRAQGLEPLDYLTAGARRGRIVFWSVVGALAVGGTTFVAGLVMMINAN